MRIRYAVTVGAVALAAAAGCAAPDRPNRLSVTMTVGHPRHKAPPAESDPTPAKRVPNVVGKNHQLAQDTLQAAGFYLLAEKDATGAGRMLLRDRNWQVVRQSPRAGTRVDPRTVTITLFSKKIGE